MKDVIYLCRSYGVSYGLLVCCLDIVYGYYFSCLCIPTKRFQKSFLFFITQIPAVSVVVIFCNAYKPTGLVPGHQHCNILRVKTGLFTDLLVPLSFRAHL